VTGKDFASASDILAKHKLKIKKTSRFSREVPIGNVIAQNPSPGRRAKGGREVEVIVCEQKGDVVVPDLRGLTLSSAKEILFRSGAIEGKGGLRTGYLAYVYLPATEKGKIIAQSPLPGTEVVRGTPVSLLISQGHWSKSFLMPKLVGMKLEDTLQKIKELGLVINQVKEIHKEGAPKGIIIDQSPPDGCWVRASDKVDLVVSKRTDLVVPKDKKESKEPKPKGAERIHLKLVRFKVPEGFYYKQVRMVVTDDSGKREMYNQKEAPGRTIETLVSITGRAKISIYVDGELVEEGNL